MKLSGKLAAILCLGIVFNIVFSTIILVIYAGLNLKTGQVLQYLDFGSSFQLFVILLLPALISAIGVWKILNKLVVDPISSLKNTTKVIASGNLGQRVAVESDDEIGELGTYISMVIKNLAGALQGMANSLRDTKLKEMELAKNVSQLEDARKVAIKALQDLNTEKDQLEQANAKDEALLTSIGDGVIATDAFGRIIFVNQETLRLLQTTSEEMVGGKFSDMVKIKDELEGPIHSSSDQIIVGKTLSGSKTSGSYYFLNKNGGIFPVSLIASPVINSNAISGSVVIFRDITKEKEIDRMKNEFISLASHQLRTPLSALRWFSEMLLDGTVGAMSQEQKDLALNINLSAQRMVELVNALLNISRIESGRIIVDPKPSDIIELLDGVVDDLKANLNQKKQTIEIKALSDLPKINLDPKLIRQVYLNLLSNSIKYSPENSKIEVTLFEKGDELISEIRDHGLGIPQAQKNRIFQKFFRADNIVKVVPEGTGLGLYLVRAIIESSNGRIWFESEEGKGTTFWFSLPLEGMEARAGEVSIDS